MNKFSKILNTVVENGRLTLGTVEELENEIEFVRSAGGKIMWVKRGATPSNAQIQNMHISERAWLGSGVDNVIHNDGTIEELRTEVRSILTYHSK